MSSLAIADLNYQKASLSSMRLFKTGTFTYIGKTQPENYDNTADSVWLIFRFDSSSGEGLQFANNDRTPNKIWDQKETYF